MYGTLQAAKAVAAEESSSEEESSDEESSDDEVGLFANPLVFLFTSHWHFVPRPNCTEVWKYVSAGLVD